MSHNYPYRRFPAQTETPPPDYDSRRPVGGESDFYGQPQPTRSLAHQQSSPSSTETPHPAQGSDVAVGLLRSYGLDPTDLARLAELPEEMLNLDSLPHLLRQLKEGRETPCAPPPPPLPATAIAPLSSRHPGASRSAAPSAPAANDQWAQIRNQPVQYPLGHILSAAKSRSFAPLSCDRQDRRADPRPAPAAGSNKHPSGAEKPPLPPSTSSCYMLDYGQQGRTAYHGTQGRADRYDRPAHGQPASGRTALPRHSQSDPAGSYGSGPARDPHRAQHRAEPPQDLLPHSRAGAGPAPTAPTRKEALDFHGSSPGAFPYSCSLCDVLALSAKVWTQHINGSHHADKQLALLQRYPEWDCRMGRKSRFNDEPEKPKDKERPALRPQTTNRKPEPQRNKRMAKKTGGGNSKVVCAKFEAKCVDEVCLRTLIEPFGKIVKVLMFPCLAFVEMGSNEQARDLEKYYGSNPAAVQGKEVTFELSSTFSFLQSSRVLSFTPAPPGEDGFSDLISVVKRFGAPLYTLALPSLAFVEMKIEAEAQKLVNYYATNSLKVNGAEIKVSFSGEYNTLMRVSTARKYEEQEKGAEGAGGGGSCVTKRSRSRSRTGSSPGADGSHPKRSRRGGEEGERKRRSSSPSRERRQGSHQPPHASDGVSLTEEAVVDADTPPAQPGSEAEVGIPAGSDPDTNEAGTTHDTAETSEEESDIEGMAVIGEDGESLDDDDDDDDDDGDGTSDTSGPPEQIKVKEEPEEETQICEEEETASVPELNDPKEVDEEGEEEEEPNFLDILENCITLDELCEEDKEENDEKEMEKEEEEKDEKEMEMEEEEKDEKEMEMEEEECIYEDKQEEGESKVIYFRNLPSSCFTDGEFVDLVKDQGKAVRYFLVPDRREGFIQMSSGSEAVLASRELLGNNPSFKGSVMDLTLTDSYPSVSAGWKVLDSGPDEDRVEGTRRSSRSSSHSASPPPPTALTEEPSHLSAAEEESPPSSRKSSSEQQEVEVPRREDTPTQEVDGSEDAASEPGSEDQEQPDEAGGDETTPTPEGQTPQTDENSEGVCLEDVESEQTAACTERLGQPQPGPAGGDVEPAKPTKPIGAEFVRPVVGYFCNLCEVIYVDEEEAKVEHCSSLIHYQKYKEHTGQDPWST